MNEVSTSESKLSSKAEYYEKLRKDNEVAEKLCVTFANCKVYGCTCMHVVVCWYMVCS